MTYRILKAKKQPGLLLDYLGMSRLNQCGKWSGVACMVIGLILACGGIGLLANFNKTFAWILGKKVVLSPTSQGFPIWKDVSQHLDTRVAWYFFNLTNAFEVADGASPEVKEIGPFWYNATLEKKNIRFIAENSSVSFEEHRSFRFDPYNSVSLDNETVIFLLNVPVISACHKIRDQGYFARSSAGYIISAAYDGNIVLNMTVQQLTYQGQTNTLVALSRAKESFAEAFQALSSDTVKVGKFGFAVDKNETHPGIFNMYTGATGVDKLNRIYSMKHKHVLDVWPDDHNNSCNIVDGTFGYLRPPMVETDEQVIYVPDMCRQMKIKYQKDVPFHGLRLRRFGLDPEMFATSKDNPKHSCYDRQFHLDSGTIEVGPCKAGAPILMSMPHFLGADPSYRERVKGLNPDPEKHMFVMDHEPITGTTVSVRARVQANLYVEPSDLHDSLPTVVVPLFWQETYVEAGPELVKFLSTVTRYPGLAKIGAWIIVLFGCILALIGFGCILNHHRRTTRLETLTAKNVSYTKAPTSETNGQKPETDALV